MRTTERHLQQCLNRIEDWATRNGFKFSKSKTQCVHFCQQRKIHNDPALYIYGSQIPVCRGPGGSIPTGNVASLVSSNCPLWEERRGNTTRLPWVATRKPEEGILEVESYWEFVLS